MKNLSILRNPTAMRLGGCQVVDFDNLPQPLETAMVIPIETETH